MAHVEVIQVLEDGVCLLGMEKQKKVIWRCDCYD